MFTAEQINRGLDCYELRDAYNNWLDEVCEPVKIGTLEYSPSEVLAEVDPTAYRVTFADYLDMLEEEQKLEADGSN